ncbi:MAG: hypothetical protein NVS3B21_04760 [Acidimicrobiales bacterium]
MTHGPVLPRALVIEDTDEIRALEVLVLRHAGWEVFEASSGADGLDLARSARVDVVLLDLELPDMDGLTVMTALHDDPATADIPVVLVTARTGTGATTRGLIAGAHDYLSKPFDAQELCDRAASALAHRLEARSGVELLDRMPLREAGSAGRVTSERIGAVLDQLPGCGVFVFDQSGRLDLAMGPVVRAEFGADPLMLEGRPAEEVGFDDALCRRVALAARGLRWSGRHHWGSSTFTVDVAPLRSPAGVIDGVVGLIRPTAP